MAIIKCKMCGGNIEVSSDKTYGTCDSCGSAMTFPKVSDEQRANLFNRANHFRRQNEFDKAVSAYERILNEDDTDAEAHWGVVLSRFGIEYVEDPISHERIPTCHRVQVSSILTDEDYLAALQHAPDNYSRELYEAEAKRIAEIQKGILAISAQEKPYDVFICYKESTDGGTRTKDSTIAQDIYYQLKQEGFKVFFSRITLEDKLGQQYEPYIFAALNSAKVMLVVGTKPEYFNAVWVKNEWSRYLAIMKQDRSRLLIPCYRDMDAYDLPDELSTLQSQDMSKIGFVQDLIRGVKKVLGGNEQTKSSGDTSPNLPGMASLLKRAKLFLEDESFDSADEYAEKVLDIDPECAEAYLIKTLIDHGMRNEAELSSSLISMQNDANFAKALRFADEQQKAIYAQIAQTIESNIHTAKLEEAYQRAIEQYKRAVSEGTFAVLSKDFAALENYKDSEELAEKCAAKSAQLRQERAEQEERDRRRREREAAEKAVREEQQRLERQRKLEQEKMRREKIRQRNKKMMTILAFMMLVVLAAGLYVKEVYIPQNKYNNAVAMLEAGRHDDAIAAFLALEGWGESETQLQNAYFAKGEDLLNAGYISSAMEWYMKAGDHVDAQRKAVLLAKYQTGVTQQQTKSYAKARKTFAYIGDFLDAKTRYEACCAEEYASAVEMLKNNNAGEAHALFRDLGEYKDSAEQADAIETEYSNAEALMVAGDWEKAMAVYIRLGTYEDSLNQAREAQLQIAEGVFAAGNYDEAIKQFEALNETDRVQVAKDAKHAYLCSLAEAELIAGNYDEAIKQFEALNETDRVQAAKDARNAEYLRIADEAFAEQKYGIALEYYLLLPQTNELKAKEYTLAQTAYEAESYEQAVKAYETLGQYELSVSRLPVARYAWANQLHTNACYKESAEQFKILGNYSDSAERVKQSTYAYGKQLLEASSYDKAKAVFASLGNYEYSATLYKDCDYRKAAALMKEGNYSAASTLFASISGFSDSDAQRKECDYLLAEADYAQGAYATARMKYDALGIYKDSVDKKNISTYKLADAQYKAGNYQSAQDLYAELGAYEDSATMVMECRLQKALIYQQNENYTLALTELADLQHGNSAQVRAQCNLALGDAAMKKANTVEAVRYYARATALLEAQENLYAIGKDYAATNQIEKAIEVLWLADAYEPAQKYLIEIGQVMESNGQTLWACISYIAANADEAIYRDKLLHDVTVAEIIQATRKLSLQEEQELANTVVYTYGVILQHAERYEEAITAFTTVKTYKDSAAQAMVAYQQSMIPALKKAVVGSYITFGSYEQDANTSNGKEGIEWLVLAKENNRMLVISRYELDCKPYNDQYTNVTWETCTLRKWLNNDFLKAAFNGKEQTIISTVTVSADKNPDCRTSPGNATQDKVFLLSILEANKYFASDSDRQCKPTAYAKKQGAYTNSNGFCWWWLRSPGDNQRSAAYVYRGGGVSGHGIIVDRDDGAVRPALWINLEP